MKSNSAPGQLSCYRCHITQEALAEDLQSLDVGKYGWWVATKSEPPGGPGLLAQPAPAGRTVMLFCPPCSGIIDGARHVLREAIGAHDETGYVFHGSPPRLPHAVGLLPSYLVVRKRDDAPAEVIPFAEEAPAREAYGYLHQNWTETYFCAVISGPGMRLPTLFDGMAAIAFEQRMQRSLGYSPKHDGEHIGGELAWAAAHYAAPGVIFRPGIGGSMRSCFPFDNEDKRAEWPRVRQLAAAGAFCASEIDRLRSDQGQSSDFAKLDGLIAKFKTESPEGREILLATLPPHDRWQVDPGLQAGDWLRVQGFASSVVVLAIDAIATFMVLFNGDLAVKMVESDAPLAWLHGPGGVQLIREVATRERFLTGVRAASEQSRLSVNAATLRLIACTAVRVAGGSEIDMAQITAADFSGTIHVNGPERFSVPVLEAVRIFVPTHDQVVFLATENCPANVVGVADGECSTKPAGRRPLPPPTPAPGRGKAHFGP